MVPGIYILSAEFGLIHLDEPIPYYDRQMTPERGLELRPVVAAKLNEIFKSEADEQCEVFICMSKGYLSALDSCKSILRKASRVSIAEGSPGKKLAELYNWLYGEYRGLPQERKAVASKGAACLRGISVSLTEEQILEKARHSLMRNRGNSSDFHSWYVPVDGRPVAPKWLASQLTGLPLSRFTTSEARRFLSRLGMEVRRL